jgi:glycosyltransferase involved in cell wall biosynthesis
MTLKNMKNKARQGPGQAARQFLKTILRFLLRYRWLFKFGQWLLKRNPDLSTRLLGMADLTTPFVPVQPLRIDPRREALDRLSEESHDTFDLIKEAFQHRPAPKSLKPVISAKLRLAWVVGQTRAKPSWATDNLALLSELSRYYEVDLFIDSSSKMTSRQKLKVQTRSLSEFPRLAAHYDRRVYQFSPEDSYLGSVSWLKRFPGTLVLNSVSIEPPLNPSEIEGAREKEFRQILYRSYGYPALLLLKKQGFSQTLGQYPGDGPLLKAAQGIIVASAEKARDIEQITSLKGDRYWHCIAPVSNEAEVAAAYHSAVEYFAFYHPLAEQRKRIAELVNAYSGQTPGDREIALLAEKTTPGRDPGDQHQLLVDVSVIACGDSKTGIQRVTRQILRQLVDQPPVGYRVEPVYRSQGLYRYARRFTAQFLGIPQLGLPDKPAGVAPGDIFLGLDLTLDMEEPDREWLRQKAQQGLKTYFILHDLLPLSMPQFFRPQIEEINRRWLEGVVSLAEGLICVSHATARDLGNWLTVHPTAARRGLRIGYFHHGADIDTNLRGSLSPAEARFLAERGGRTLFLMVGTLEPRKGYQQTIQAFEELWEKGEDIDLVVVGKVGWKTGDLIQHLKKHPEKGHRFFWFDQASDVLLVALYRQASVLLMASEGEGFGLPLIEAARYGLPLIVRDLAVFHEVVGEQAFYFRGTRPADLASAIKAWLELYRQCRQPPSDGVRWLSWAESADQLKQVILAGRWAGNWDPVRGITWEDTHHAG